MDTLTVALGMAVPPEDAEDEVVAGALVVVDVEDVDDPHPATAIATKAVKKNDTTVRLAATRM